MSFDLTPFDSTRNPGDGQLAAVVRLREEIHAAQLWVDSFLPAGARVRHTLAGLRCFSLECPPGALEAIAVRPEVTHIQPDLEVRSLLENTLDAVRVRPLWEEGLTGKGIRLAVLDTGIDRGHPDFEGRIATLEDFTGCGVRDDVGHGTHVASIAAGSGEASRGRFRGVAPASSLLVARVLDSKGLGRMSDVMAGLLWALTREARVINLSLGTLGPGSPGDALGWAVDEITARGVVVVAASGDSGSAPVSPASSASAVRVESYDSLAFEPSEGTSGAEAAVIAAPGHGVVAARAFGTKAGKPHGEQYVSVSGSSAAAAHASGLCALLLEEWPQATPEDIRGALKAGGRALPDGRAALTAPAALAELRERRRRSV